MISAHPHILENSFTALIIANSAGDILWTNNSSEQLFSTSRKRLSQYKIDNLLEPVTPENVTAEHTTIKNTGHPSPASLTFPLSLSPLSPLVCHDQWITGTQQPLLVNYSISLIDAEPQQYLIEIWAKDRHHLISQEQQQQTQHDIARKMLRSVAHEVKNPLAGIRGAGQLLAKHLKQHQQLDSKTQTYTDIIISEIDRITQLLNQLIGTKQAIKLPQYTTINIHEPIEHVLTLLQSEIEQNETKKNEIGQIPLNIVRDYDLSLPEITADKEQLIQVLLNLAKNALQAMQARTNAEITSTQTEQPPHSKQTEPHTTDVSLPLLPVSYIPTLTISTRVEFSRTIGKIKHKQVAKISVMDNGIGIKKELIEQIFFPLVTGRADGTGLGLSIVQDIIQQHHGQIEVNSKFGETCFSFYLPFQHALNNITGYI